MRPQRDAAPEREGPLEDWRLVRFLARHCVNGIAAGWAVLLGFVWTDVGRIGTLLHSTESGWLGYLMLIVAFAGTGGAVGMGVAVMSLGQRR